MIQRDDFLAMCEPLMAKLEKAPPEMQPRCRRNAAGMQPRCGRETAGMPPGCSRETAEMQPLTAVPEIAGVGGKACCF